QRRPHGLQRDPEDLLRVVLDPAGTRVVLCELAIASPENRSVLVDQERRGAGGALIEGENGSHQPARGATSSGANTPRSVMIAVTSSAGVTSNAGFHTRASGGAAACPRQPATSSGAR